MDNHNVEKLRTLGFSLREAKHVVTKQAILSNYMALITEENRMDIPIEKVYTSINISKATFFNYFSRREDVYLYQLQIWFYEVFSIYKKNAHLSCEATLYLLFDALAQKLAEHRIYLECFVQLSHRLVLESHNLKPLTEAEIALLNVNAYYEEQPILSFGPVLEEIRTKAILDDHPIGKIPVGDFFESLHIIFVGGASYADANSSISLQAVYQKQLTQYFMYCKTLGGSDAT